MQDNSVVSLHIKGAQLFTMASALLRKETFPLKGTAVILTDPKVISVRAEKQPAFQEAV